MCIWIGFWLRLRLLCTKHGEAISISATSISTMDSDIAIYVLYFVLQISILYISRLVQVTDGDAWI